MGPIRIPGKDGKTNFQRERERQIKEIQEIDRKNRENYYRKRDLIEGARSDAQEFEAGKEGLIQQRIGSLMPTFNQALEEGTRKTRENYGRRGLLYSGLARRDEGSLRGQLASQLAKSRIGIRQEVGELGRKKQEAAAALDLDNMQSLMQSAEDYYNLSMQNDLQRRKAMGSLASGLGYGLGAYYGNKGNAAQNTRQGTFMMPASNYEDPSGLLFA